MKLKFSFFKVNELVEKVIQSRQNLNHEGPRIVKLPKARQKPNTPPKKQAS